MIFSGQVHDYKCPACGYETQKQFSTAFGYWVALITLSCAVLFPVLRHRFGPHHGWYGLFVIVADLALLALLIPLTTYLVNRHVPKDLKCPRCSGQLERTGGGFYDFGLIPVGSDILVGLVFLFAHIATIFLLLRNDSSSAHVSQRAWSVKIMKPSNSKPELKLSDPDTVSDELLPEYRFDYTKARPNRFATPQTAVVLDPDVAAVFTTPEAVNAVLRALIQTMPPGIDRETVLRK